MVEEDLWLETWGNEEVAKSAVVAASKPCLT